MPYMGTTIHKSSNGLLKLKWGRSIPEIEKRILWHDRFVMADGKITYLNIVYTQNFWFNVI